MSSSLNEMEFKILDWDSISDWMILIYEFQDNSYNTVLMKLANDKL